MRTLRQVYAIVAYVAFLASMAWAAEFLAVDPPGGGRFAWLIDSALLLGFAVQHTVMARPWFKRHLPAGIERPSFVLASALALGLLLWQWRPVPAVVWQVRAAPWVALIWLLYGAGWLIAVAATFMIDHGEFVGLRRPIGEPVLEERYLYRFVRHPMMLGLLIAFWATPRMTVGHLFFAAAGSAYVAVGIQFEERELRRTLGRPYRDYARRVPALVPRLALRRSGSVEVPPAERERV
jgi:protein-S-isoprenylcysteine O-methyltransferase Ste14